MKLNQNVLTLDVKIQDKYRKWFSALGTDANYLKSTCVILGDSDIDYELAPNIKNSRILSAPFSSEGIKYKMIYNGVGKNLSGVIKCFARRVNTDGSVDSLYDYPLNENFSTDTTPPILANGKNWENIPFTDAKMGYILYFSTVLDFYLDENGVKQRLEEKYDFTFDWNGTAVTPANWSYIIDLDNGSILLLKEDTTSTPIGMGYIGTISVVGQSTKKIKAVHFNF